MSFFKKSKQSCLRKFSCHQQKKAKNLVSNYMVFRRRLATQTICRRENQYENKCVFVTGHVLIHYKQHKQS